MMITLKRKYRLRKSASYCASLNQKVLSEKNRQENNLTIVSVVTCAIETSYYFYIFYAFLIHRHMNTRVFYLLYNVFNDVYAGASPWLILSFSTALQQHIRDQLRCTPSKAAPHCLIRKVPLSSASHLTIRRTAAERSSLVTL
ncbi:unnamed protein product [Nippostrongylus brasiliensis]|uniref:G_PROTEIN_RECEP_F1_2 domain-containing protein n=1 Tax=Nippostrongylus brasiliensis TaxID=27835 RepID=A0A0N4YEU7_NIPBR|nr:unnamed protein product [Nippostrongylus brasiliensis]